MHMIGKMTVKTLRHRCIRHKCKKGECQKILPEFFNTPDDIDYLPKGSIVRKLGVMSYLLNPDKSIEKFITLSKYEYANVVEDTIQLVAKQFAEKILLKICNFCRETP